MVVVVVVLVGGGGGGGGGDICAQTDLIMYAFSSSFFLFPLTKTILKRTRVLQEKKGKMLK